MSYLDNYLEIVPQVDAAAIRAAIAQNQEYFRINNLNETEFEALLAYLVTEDALVTQLVDLTQKVSADPLNTFYSNAFLDLTHLFLEQNQLEKAGVNYNRIYEGNLDELRQEVRSLQTRVDELAKELSNGETVQVKAYSFEPENASANQETDSQTYAYLFQDRDGTPLEPAVVNRYYHTYHLSLAQDQLTDLLHDANGNATARIKLAYQSPYVLDNTNEHYTIDKTTDNDSSTFWFSVALKPDNGSDRCTINPE